MNSQCTSESGDNCYCYTNDYRIDEDNINSNTYTSQNYFGENDRLGTYYRPRGQLARSLYNKYLADVKLKEFDKSKWYFCDTEKMSESVREKYLPLGVDSDTDDFLSQAIKKSDWVFIQLWYSLAKSVLGWFMTQTSINGLLGRGSMFVYSLSHFRMLLSADVFWRGGNLLDLGAGDGKATESMSPLFENTYVTEISGPMRWILAKRGYHILEVESWHLSGIQFDVIACLNLLDRCDAPESLLKNIRESLAPGGRAIIALVFPYNPYVEIGRPDHMPSEWLPIKGDTFEEQVNSTITNVFECNGFNVERWSRVPYLCEGDLNQAFYWLDDA